MSQDIFLFKDGECPTHVVGKNERDMIVVCSCLRPLPYQYDGQKFQFCTKPPTTNKTQRHYRTKRDRRRH